MAARVPFVTNPRFLAVHEGPLYDDDECDRILSLLESDWRSARIVAAPGRSPDGVDPDVRSVVSQPLPDDGGGWPTSALVDALAEVNESVYRYDVRAILAEDSPSVLRYEADTNDHYRPHRDAGEAHAFRKLTVVVQLTSPSEYVGGDLIISDLGRATTRSRGTLIVFPSFLTHTVTPVVRGTRHCIVGWLHGPTFR